MCYSNNKTKQLHITKILLIMRNPFSTVIPQTCTHLIFIFRLLLFIIIPFIVNERYIIVREVRCLLIKLIPKRLILLTRGGVNLVGRFVIFTIVRLIPYRVTRLHFPLFGVGIRISIWISILLVRIWLRPFQFKRELFSNPSLRLLWVMCAIILESIRRIARAITLGARIRVNILIGRVLHSIIGNCGPSWGLLILCVLEFIVVITQSYVFILLLYIYRRELE